MILINKELWSIVNKEKVRPSENAIPAEQLNQKIQADKVMAKIHHEKNWIKLQCIN